MIRRIQAINYRSLRHVDQTLGDFHVLVGPNASGKSTFLSVISFLSDLVSIGLDAAYQKAGTTNPLDLMWNREGGRFEIGVEATIPEEHRSALRSPDMDSIRYEVAVGLDEEGSVLSILQEQIVLMSSAEPSTMFVARNWGVRSNRLVARLDRNTGEWSMSVENPERLPEESGNPYYYQTLIPKQSIFDGLRREKEFPVSMWLANQLRGGIKRIELQSRALRQVSPAGKGNVLLEDGSNLPWVVDEFQKQSPDSANDWLAHLRTALPDLQGIRSVKRPEDNERYLMLKYGGDLEVPSWMVSDGTLRLLALTILAYLPGPKPIYLIEEPENSIHPRNIETVMQSLQSVYDGQVLVTTHSPTLLAVTDVKDVLVFARDETNGTQIITGDKHPALQDWHRETTLGELFVAGVLG